MTALTGRVIDGPAGTATEVIYVRSEGDRPDWAAGISTWFLHCPGQSVGWDDYILAAVHLRDFEGQTRPAHKQFPSATHEVLLYALDPRTDPTPTSMYWPPLIPVNLVHQLQLPTDLAAREIVDRCARCVVDGELWAEPPLSGQVEPWRSTLERMAREVCS